MFFDYKIISDKGVIRTGAPSTIGVNNMQTCVLGGTCPLFTY
jgi:hypothetical protein